jgi:ribonuclease P protein component
LVVHHRPGLRVGGPPLVGLVVGRNVGNSVVRHRVSRRLRAQLAALVPDLPAGSGTVVRARPDTARATSAQLGRDLGQGLARILSADSRGRHHPLSGADARG